LLLIKRPIFLTPSLSVFIQTMYASLGGVSLSAAAKFLALISMIEFPFLSFFIFATISAVGVTLETGNLAVVTHDVKNSTSATNNINLKLFMILNFNYIPTHKVFRTPPLNV